MLELLAQLDPPAQNVLLVAIGTLWTATTTMVVIGWKFMVKRLNACERDRTELWETLAQNGIKKSKTN